MARDQATRECVDAEPGACRPALPVRARARHFYWRRRARHPCQAAAASPRRAQSGGGRPGAVAPGRRDVDHRHVAPRCRRAPGRVSGSAGEGHRFRSGPGHGEARQRAEGPHDTDLEEGAGRVVLPGALGRKYPHAAVEWGWQFVFPASRVCRDPRWGPPSRFHLHESVVQKAVAAGCSSVWDRQSAPVRTRSGTVSPRISWRTATTSARFRS